MFLGLIKVFSSPDPNPKSTQKNIVEVCFMVMKKPTKAFENIIKNILKQNNSKNT